MVPAFGGDVRAAGFAANASRVQGGSAARVTLADQTTWKAALVGAFPDRDLAVLRIDAPEEKIKPVALNGKPIASLDELLSAIEQHQPGNIVTVSLARGDKRLEQPIRLALPG